MNLIIDIGNTCAKLACFDGYDIVEEQRIDRGEVYLLDKFCSKYNFDRGILSSVADVSPEMRQRIDSLPFKMMELVSGKTPVPIEVKYATPLTLGTDRLAAAVAVAAMQPGSDIMIVDIGTCITFDYVSAKGEYLGGNISLGPSMRFKALHQFTARLPKVERRGVVPDIGTTTMTAIRSGVLKGIRYEMEGYINTFVEEHPSGYIYITGGVHLNPDPEATDDQSRITDFTIGKNEASGRIVHDDYIVPRGLNCILLYNSQQERHESAPTVSTLNSQHCR